MAEADGNELGDGGGSKIQDVVQSMLVRQEQQFNNLLQEHQLQNNSIFIELGEIKRQLTSLGISATLPSHQVAEESLGPIHGDHTGLPTAAGSGDYSISPVANKEASFIESQENSLVDDDPNKDQGQNLLEAQQKQMDKLLAQDPHQSFGFHHVNRGEAEAAGQIKQLEAKLSALEKANHSLQERYTRVVEEKSELEKEAREVREQLEAAREERGSDEKCRVEIERLQSVVKRLEEHVKTKDGLFNSVKKQNDTYQRDLLRLEKERDEMATKTRKNDDMMTSLLDDKKYFSAKVGQQEKRISELRPLAEEAEICKLRYSKLEAQLRASDGNFQQKCEEYQQLQEKWGQFQAQYDQQISEVSWHQSNIQGYEKAIRDKDELIRNIRADKESLEESMSLQVQLTHEDLTTKVKECQLLKESSDLNQTELQHVKDELREAQRKIEANKNLENQANFPYAYQSIAPGPPGAQSLYSVPPYATQPTSYIHSSSTEYHQ